MADRRDDLSARLARVASKLAVAASLPGEPVMFGAGSHRFRIGPALPEDAVVAFEKRHGVRLPADYRGFITTIGHGGPGRFGGAGPFYGLFSIEDWEWALLSNPDVTMLARPFPAEPGRVYDDWLAEAAPGEDDEPYRGALALSHQGCGDLSLLVLSGPARGRVVETCPGKQGPRFTEDPDSFPGTRDGWTPFWPASGTSAERPVGSRPSAHTICLASFLSAKFEVAAYSSAADRAGSERRPALTIAILLTWQTSRDTRYAARRWRSRARNGWPFVSRLL